VTGRLKRLAAVLLLLLLTPAVRAHIGSLNVFFEGPAGPYPVRVTIVPPGVVPGLALIHVRVFSGKPEKVTVLPVRWNAGTRGAPPPDVAKLVPGETNLYTAQLWLMDSGSYSVFVDVAGPEGHGTAIVPINSLALERLVMPRWKGIAFLAVGVFLFVLFVSIVGTAIRQASLAPGSAPTRANSVRAGIGMGIAGLIALGLVAFGNRWWGLDDKFFLTQRLYHSGSVTPEIHTDASGHQELHVGLAKSGQFDRPPLVPDHEHLMHLFLIRSPGGDAFVHLHPLQTASNGFNTRLPAMPAGDYRLFADLTYESGFSETLTNTLHIAESPVAGPSDAPTDADDSFDLSAPVPPGPVTLPGGFTLTPKFSEKLGVNQETTLRFELNGADGSPALLEPYLGMYGHLIIMRENGDVFTHLHPLGSISMASQKLFAEREHAGYLANQPLELLCAPASRALSFPFAFPKAGRYQIWLQVKLGGQVRTVGYAVMVE